MVNKFSKTDKEALNKELDIIINDYNLYDEKIINNKRIILEKLNNKKLDDVIHELFSKNDIINFLASSNLSINNQFDKLHLAESLEGFTCKFILEIFSKISDLNDPSEEQRMEQNISKFFEKNNIVFDEKDNSHFDREDEIQKYIEDYTGSRTYDYEGHYNAANSVNNYEDTYTLGTNIVSLKGSIDSKDMQTWLNDHLLVKDLDNGMATLELVY